MTRRSVLDQPDLFAPAPFVHVYKVTPHGCLSMSTPGGGFKLWSCPIDPALCSRPQDLGQVKPYGGFCPAKGPVNPR